MAEKESTVENYFLNRMKAAGLYYGDSLSELEIPDEILKKVSQDFATQYHVLPIKEENGILSLATDTQQAFKQRRQIEQQLKQNVRLILATEENVRLALLKFYQISSYRKSGSMIRHSVEVDMTPLKGVINTILQTAAREGASDIHIRPNTRNVAVIFRINGHMYDETDRFKISAADAMNVTNLIKQMDESGNMDIAKTNMPNEGSFFTTHGAQEIFVRMESMPIGNEGEWQYLNLRLLPQAGANSQAKRLDDIGYTKEDLEVIKRTLYKNATGLFINSGPTGAGKTTSLYAQIYYVLDTAGEQLHVITIDDPIEIREEQFTQVQVRKAINEAISLTDNKILTASLRADPDIILYNEIRDSQGATVAMQASTTGHKVFSTVHASDCIRTISRLLDLDVSRSTLLSELRLIISQRLVATLCPYCSVPHELTEEEKGVLSEKEIQFLMADGGIRQRGNPEAVRLCPHCNHGITGRTAIAEYVVFNTDIRDALLHQKSFADIQSTLRRFGYKSMWEKGLEMVKHREIELSELIRVVGKEE